MGRAEDAAHAEKSPMGEAISSHDSAIEALKQTLKERIATLPRFQDLHHEAFESIWNDLQWFSLPGGMMLFKEGEQGDAVYFVIAGWLAVATVDASGFEHLLARIGPGKTVGEMALISGEPRSASVFAVRDCELLRLPASTFERLMSNNLHAQRFLIEVLSRRLRNASHPPASEDAPRTLAILPLLPAVRADDLADALARELEALGSRTAVLRQDAGGHEAQWFANVEERNDIVLYQANCDTSEWTRFCLRQADRVLLLLSSGPPPKPAEQSTRCCAASATARSSS